MTRADREQEILNNLLESEDLQNSDPKVRFRCLRETKNDIDEDVVCDVCLDDNIEDDDEILLCDLCNSAVH